MDHTSFLNPPRIRRFGRIPRGLPTLAVMALLVFALLLTACGSDESAIPPADSTASAGSDTAPAATQAAGSANTAPAAAPTQPAGTSASTGAPASADPVKVVASNALLADLVNMVGGDRVAVNVLVPAGADAHSWNSTPQDSVRIAEASLIVSNGAGLSAQVDSLIDNAASSDAVHVVASEGLEPQELVELPFPDAHDDDHGHGHEDEHEGEVMGRLLVGDGEGSGLSVIDLESGEVIQDALDLGSRAGRIYSTSSGRFAIAVSSDANTAHIIDGGIYLEEHGDHFDLVEASVRSLNIDLTGDRPSHLYVSGEVGAIYYDGSGDIVIIDERELEHEGDAYNPIVLNAGPQHGAAIPLAHDLIVTTIKHPEYPGNPDARLPIGAEIRDIDGHILYSAEECPDLHGDAANGHMAVFGCTGGVMAIEADHGEYGHAFIPGPPGSPDDFRLTSVYGYPDLHHFLAMGSDVGLYIVEPEDGAMEQFIPATEELKPIQVAFSHDGELLLVLMSDGELRAYDAHDFDLLESASGFLSDNIDPGFWARPHFATAPGLIFITDSAAGEVFALDADHLEVVDHWHVEGKPNKIAFVGILESGDHPEQGHDDQDRMQGQDSNGHDDHGHDHGEGDPHFWLNPRLVVHYVNQISNGLVATDPDNASIYLDNAAAYIEKLEELDTYITDSLSGISHERRVIVTFHDAFGYFGSRYDFEVMAFVGAHAGDVSPDDISRVIDLVEDQGLPAVFAEPQFSADALEQVARDADISLGYIRALPDNTYPDYISMMRANAEALAELLH